MNASPAKPSSATWQRGWLWWCKVCGVLGVIELFTGLYSFFAPNIGVTLGATLDPAQAFQTQFVVANNGHFDLYDVHFGCAIHGPRAVINELSTSRATLTPIEALPAGKSASRGCFQKSDIPLSGGLEVDTHYTWPWRHLGWDHVDHAYFKVEQGTAGNFLVPEIPNDGDPLGSKSALIRVDG